MRVKLEDFSPGSSVYIKENGVEKEYIVLQHGYPLSGNGYTLLLRKMLIGDVIWDDTDNEYNGSTVDNWLNDEFLASLDSEIISQLGFPAIPYCTGNGTYTVTTLNRSIFLLSGTELGYEGYTGNDIAVEGNAIPYFDPASNKPYFAYHESDPTLHRSWWLRSPKIDTTSYVWCADTRYETDLTVNSPYGYVRPAFILPSSFAINTCAITLDTPMNSAELITKAALRIARSIPGDAKFKVEVTNNANDAEPVWEDATNDVLFGRNHLFENTVVAQGNAFNFRIAANRGPSGEGGYIYKVEGAFE